MVSTQGATARPDAPAVTDESQSFVARRRRGRVGQLAVYQLVAVEVAVLAVVLSLFSGAPLMIGGAALLALALLVAAFGRANGRWWYEQVALRRHMRQRRDEAAAAVLAARVRDPQLADPRYRDVRVAALAGVAPPELTVRLVEDRGTRIGVGQDSGGWFAVLTVAPWPSLTGARDALLAMDRLARVFTESPVPVSALQVVSHTVPAPVGVIDAQAPCMRSYAELLGGQLVAADQILWVAVRLDPRDAADAAASRGGGVAGVHKALAATVSRVGKTLRGSGLSYAVLDDQELLDALVSSCGLDDVVADGRIDDDEIRGEDWTSWSAGGKVHTTFWLSRWPRQLQPRFMAALAQVPASLVSVSTTLRPRADGVGVRCLIRVAAPAEQLDGSVHGLAQIARASGIRLQRLDGEHALGVYATAPTGGGPA